MNGIKERIDKAAESILENEDLTADLDDAAAQALLDWGIACAKRIAQNTLGLDDMEAEEAMYQPMRATRRLMRAVNNWASRHEILGDRGRAEELEKIIEQAGAIYGGEYAPPASDQQSAFLAQSSESIADIPQWIAQL
ncbi:MAG: hypothetical protein AB1649_30570, partial [Chloroflexota bacterium]